MSTSTVRVILRGKTEQDDVTCIVHEDDEALFMQFAVKLLERLEAELKKDWPPEAFNAPSKGMSWPTVPAEPVDVAQEAQEAEIESQGFLSRWKHKRAL